MENLNNVPSTGTFGNSINQVNANFSLIVNAINSLEYATTKSKGILNYGKNPATEFPNAVAGDWCMILSEGNVFPATIKTYDGSTWSGSGTWNPDGVDLTGYAKTTDMTTAIANSLAQATARMGYGECTVNGTSLAVLIPNFILPTSGGTIHIKMSAAGTGASTLNINDTGAKALWYNGEAVSSDNTWEAGEVISVFYDGNRFMASNAQGGSSSKSEYVIAKAFANHEKRLNSALLGDESYVLAKALSELKRGIKNAGSTDGSTASQGIVKGSVEWNTSDTIVVLSSSFGTGSFNVEGKNWVSNLSLFSDYAFKNNSADGWGNLNHLGELRRLGSYKYKYAFVNDQENDSSLSPNARVKALDNLCRVLTGMGVQPIIGTQWYKNNLELGNAYKTYADAHKWIFADLYFYLRDIGKSLSSGFDAGTHLGTRNSASMTDFYLKYIDMLPRPVKSLKVFKLRSSQSTSSLDSLVFMTNEERAERFKELNITGTKLPSAARVDTPSGAGNIGATMEYEQLTTGMQFTDAALISAVLPCSNHSLRKLSLSVSLSGDTEVYVRNIVAREYLTPTNYVRFTISDTSVGGVSSGDVYSDGTNNYTVFTTVAGENGSNYTMYCTGTFNEEDPQVGELQKVSGIGPSTVPYTMREVATYSAEDVVWHDTVGHWVKVNKINGEYDITSLIKSCVDYDKVHFLVVGDSFTMSSPSVIYEGIGDKVYDREYKEFKYNQDNTTSELMQESVFGSAGTQLTYWKDNNNVGLVTETIYEGNNKLPSGCGSVVNVTDEITMKQTFPPTITSSPVQLEIWCRYFPAIYSDGTGNQITVDSYDYNTLNVQVGSITLKQRVSTAWGKYTFDLRQLSEYDSTNKYIKLFADNSYGIQICKVSLKHK